MPCYNIEMDLLGLHPRLPLVLPSLQSCLPVERQSWKDSNTVSKSQGPELGFSNTAIAQGERGGHSRKARAEQGWMMQKQPPAPTPPPSLQRYGRGRRRRAAALGETPSSQAWALPCGYKDMGFGAGEPIFCIIMFRATVVLVWHYCN